jgi:Ca-activated chloride channel family protein
MSEVMGGVRSGLLVEGAPIPLDDVAVEAQVRAFAARVTLRQRYRNREAHPIEAVYTFPLDEGAAVCGFEAQIGETRVVGRVEEREAAFARYDDALAAGHGAYLLDQERPDVFTASVGNVPPGAEVAITLVTVAELAPAGDGVRFVLPTTVSPRYAPAHDRVGVGRAPSDALNPPVALRVPYGLTVTVDVDLGVALRAVESPSHPIAVEVDGTRARVTLGERTAALDRDFVLLARAAEAPPPQAWLEVGDDGQAGVMLTFQPRFEAGPAPSELLFLIDRSGSMEGTSIAEARNALQLCLRSLGGEHLFNIIGFGTQHSLLFPESRRYDDASLAAASAHVSALQADMGGTEILGALEAALATPARPGVPRQLFVLTDGQVTNTAEVIQCVRRHSDRARVFTFGIGAGASAHLVRGMARAGEGAAEFIAPGERVEGKVLRQLERALAPAASDLRVDWGGLSVTQAPHRVPPVFAGGRVIVYGLLPGRPRATHVTLRGHGPSGAFAATIEVDPAAARRERVVVTLAARALIRDLEEGLSALHDRRGSLQERGREDRVKAEIVRLGTTYGLASRETSFVAVEERATPLHGEAQLRRIAVALTRGWGGIDDALLGARVPGGPPLRPPAAAVTAAFIPPRLSMRLRPSPPLIEDLTLSEEEPDFVVAPAPSYVSESTTPPLTLRALDRLVALQRADGSWDLTTELAEVLGQTLSALEAELSGAQGDLALARRAWATALALRWLELHAGDCRDEWRLLARKAEGWLRGCPARPAADDWVSAAARRKL